MIHKFQCFFNFSVVKIMYISYVAVLLTVNYQERLPKKMVYSCLMIKELHCIIYFLNSCTCISSVAVLLTANYPESVVDNLPKEMPLGVYYGWGSVDDGEVYKMVLSVGWNLYYKNTKKSMVSQYKKTLKSPWKVHTKTLKSPW